ncbi:MAG: hypothetical protein AAF493_30070 [Pseudomonadota bacterium]
MDGEGRAMAVSNRDALPGLDVGIGPIAPGAQAPIGARVGPVEYRTQASGLPSNRLMPVGPGAVEGQRQWN